MENLTINIFWSEFNNGYMYEIYDKDLSADSDTESVDGGSCTGTISDALTMATELAQALILKTERAIHICEKNECENVTEEGRAYCRECIHAMTGGSKS